MRAVLGLPLAALGLLLACDAKPPLSAHGHQQARGEAAAVASVALSVRPASLPVPAASAMAPPPPPLPLGGPTVPTAPSDDVRTVSLGGAHVSGGNVANVGVVVASLRGRLKQCYARDTDARSGSLRLTLHIGPTGAVTDVGATNQQGALSDELTACVTAEARAARFDAPTAGEATIQFSAMFVSSSRGTIQRNIPWGKPPGGPAPPSAGPRKVNGRTDL